MEDDKKFVEHEGVVVEADPKAIDPVGPLHEKATAIAIIVDDEVVDILYTNDVLAAAFLSQPKLVDVTTLMADPFVHPASGWAYDEEQNSFIGMDNEGNAVSLAL